MGFTGILSGSLGFTGILSGPSRERFENPWCSALENICGKAALYEWPLFFIITIISTVCFVVLQETLTSELQESREKNASLSSALAEEKVQVTKLVELNCTLEEEKQSMVASLEEMKKNLSAEESEKVASLWVEQF